MYLAFWLSGHLSEGTVQPVADVVLNMGSAMGRFIYDMVL